MGPDEPYARLTAFFPEGEVIYSNPFARYDSALAADPFDNSPQRVSVLWTILYNLLLLGLFGETVRLWIKFLRK